MREKRFLKVLYISFILGIGILLSLNLLSFEFSGFDPDLAIAANANIRTSDFFFGYPTSLIGGGLGLYGTGLYPGLGLGYMPISQNVSLAQVTPLTSSTLNSTYYRDLFTTYGSQASTFANPFAIYGSTSMQYADPFSQAAANSMSYSNIFGVNLNQGQGFYRDPFYTTGGKYINYSSPVGGFSSDMGYSMTPLGGTTHLGSSLTTPWTHIHTNINTAAGVLGAGTSIEHAAFGMPTVFDAMGFSKSTAGVMNLLTYGSQTAAMDRMLSNTYAYTKEGMPYVPVASYYNAASVGGTNYFFEGDISYQEAGTMGTGPFTTGYNVVQEIPSSLVPAVGAAVAATSTLTNPAFAGYVGTPVGAAPYGGWTGGASAASTGAVSGGLSGAAFAGWGAAPSGASFGMVSGGWGGGMVGGGMVGGGMVGGGMAGGGMAGGAVGGGFTSGAGVSYGGAPGLGW
ncbi:MAG: hypothetical protein ACMUIU_04615 [bacterium]